MIAASHKPLRRVRVRKRVRDRTPRTETLHRLNFIEPGSSLDPEREKRIAAWFIRFALTIGLGVGVFAVLLAIEPDLQPVIDFLKGIYAYFVGQ